MDELAAAADPTPIIIRAGWTIALSTISLDADTLASILASEAGNLALKILATDGVYLGGGLPRRLLTVFKKSECFVQMVRRKGRLADVLDRLPVQVILNSMVGLLGAALHGLNRADTMPESSGVDGA